MPSLIALTSATRVIVQGVPYVQFVITDIDGLSRTMLLRESDYALLKAVVLAAL